MFCWISADTLPLAARWLTRTGLCWLAAYERQAETHQDGAPALGLRQAACGSASGHPLQGPPRAPGHQPALRLRRSLPLARHHRTLGANGTLEPLVAADLDLVNMCGNAEWLRIREALRTRFPEAAA